MGCRVDYPSEGLVINFKVSLSYGLFLPLNKKAEHGGSAFGLIPAS